MKALLALVLYLSPAVASFVGRGPRGAPLLTNKAVGSQRQQVGTVLHALEKKTGKAYKETFKKADFISAVSEKTGLSKIDSEAVMQAVLRTIMEQVGAGKRVTLSGFGSFVLKERAARKGRNPQTGEELQIAASKAPGFSPAKAWKDEVNGR